MSLELGHVPFLAEGGTLASTDLVLRAEQQEVQQGRRTRDTQEHKSLAAVQEPQLLVQIAVGAEDVCQEEKEHVMEVPAARVGP